MATPASLPDSAQAASLPRVLAACVYDALLTLAIVFTAGVAAVFINGGTAVPAADPLFRVFLIVVAFPYYGFCWTHGGQTLGMRTWRIRLIADDDAAVGLRHALMRYLGALVSLCAAGLGFLWILVDRRRRSWHDLLSGTRLVVLPSGRR